MTEVSARLSDGVCTFDNAATKEKLEELGVDPNTSYMYYPPKDGILPAQLTISGVVYTLYRNKWGQRMQFTNGTLYVKKPSLQGK